MAVFNAEKYILESIESIIQQTYQNLEIIICDDCSTDNSQLILKELKDPRIKLIYNEKNLGYLRTMNKLLTLSNGDLITTQDADDISEVNRIEVQLSAFLNDSELGLCGTGFKIIDKNGDEITAFIKNKLITEYVDLRNEIFHQFPFSKARVMFEKEVLDKIGYYRLFFDRIGWEDYDWTSRVVENFKAINIPDELYLYRLHLSAVNTGNTDIKKYFGDKIVQFLIHQRKGKGIDSLDNGNMAELNKKTDELSRPFQNDTSTIYRIESHSYINMAMYIDSLRFAMVAIRTKPFLIKNYTNIIYCCYIIIRRNLSLKIFF